MLISGYIVAKLTHSDIHCNERCEETTRIRPEREHAHYHGIQFKVYPGAVIHTCLYVPWNSRVGNNIDAPTALDSFSSVIGYAFLSAEDSRIAPLIQTPQDSLQLRPENMDAFKVASLDPSFLLTSFNMPLHAYPTTSSLCSS